MGIEATIFYFSQNSGKYIVSLQCLIHIGVRVNTKIYNFENIVYRNVTSLFRDVFFNIQPDLNSVIIGPVAYFPE